MSLLKYFLVVVVIQALTVMLTLLYIDGADSEWGWLKLAFSLLVGTCLGAFWLDSLSEGLSKDKIAKMRETFASEREELRVKAERAKTRVVKEAQKQIASEAKITHAKANFKVGAAFAGTIAAGAVMLFIEMLTLGLLTMTTAGGALGGYLFRAKKDYDNRDRLAHQGDEKRSATILDRFTKPKILTDDKAQVVGKKTTKPKK